MDGLLHLVQRGGDWAGPQSALASPRCTKYLVVILTARQVLFWVDFVLRFVTFKRCLSSFCNLARLRKNY